jgi:hypothetical protein
MFENGSSSAVTLKYDTTTIAYCSSSGSGMYDCESEMKIARASIRTCQIPPYFLSCWDKASRSLTFSSEITFKGISAAFVSTQSP